LHNLSFYQRLMSGLRKAIEQGRFEEYVQSIGLDGPEAS